MQSVDVDDRSTRDGVSFDEVELQRLGQRARQPGLLTDEEWVDH
jgi:hypothetical protein